ncbi:MAG: hypothetical protein ACR2N3_07670 [Pyrinomonadaceae bacterium]
MSIFLTRKIFIPLSNFRRRRQTAMRPVFEFYREGLEFRRGAKNWDAAQKEKWILESLRRALRRAAAETDYYAELFRQIGFDAKSDFSFKDFSKLPILERENIAEAKEKIITKKIPREKLLKDSTGGSTGEPTEIFLGAEELGWKESGIEFAFEKIGVSTGAKTAFFWGHHLDPRAADNFRQRLRSLMTNTRYFDCFRLSPEILRKYHEEFERFSPDCIVAYSSALAELAEFLRENKIRPRNYPKICFVTGAEKLYDEHRKIIEEVFGKPVHERYGGRDFGAIGIQTNPRESLDYEIDWAWGLVEPETDAENAPILVTKFHADGMPLIRYRTGDVGRFPAGSRAGHPAFILREVTGRELDRIWLKNENWVSGAEFPHLLKSFAVREYMLIQAEDYSVTLEIVPKKEFDETQKREILRTIEANLKGLPVNLKVVEKLARTQANKWRPVISKVKR